MKITFLGAKAPAPGKLEDFPEGFRLSLGSPAPGEMDLLLQRAFDLPKARWVPSDNLAGLVLVRHESGRLAAACSVLSPFFLHQFCVDPDFQMQGLGGKLLAHTVQLFDLPYVLVGTDETTTEAGHRFWVRQGFKEIAS